VALTVNGTIVAATTYGPGSTPESVAAGLTASGSGATVVAVGNVLYIEGTTSGNDSSYSVTSTSLAGFNPPSFSGSPASGDLEGAVTTGGVPVYNYSIPEPSNSSCSSLSSGFGYDCEGNVLNYSDSVMGTWSAVNNGTSGYTSLNQLASATLTPAGYTGALQMNWSYDSFGNRTSENFSGNTNLSVPTGSSATYNTNNQVQSTSLMLGGPLGYDLAGNVVQDNQNKYFYDPEGRICEVQNLLTGTMTGYLYDAEGNRVAKGIVQAWGSCDPAANGFQVSTETDEVLGQSGEQMAELAMDANGIMAWQHTNVWAAGNLIGTYDNNGLHFYFDDWLGTRRAQTDYEGNIEQTCFSLPYGNGESCKPFPTEHLFTGKERDAESGLDYFGARYYASSMGRFMSPDYDEAEDDPEPVPYADLENPQTLNLYAYGRNNPLGGVDVDGHDGPGLLSQVVTDADQFVSDVWAEGVASGWLPAAGAGGISLGGAATGGIGVIGGAMLFPKDLDPGELTPAQQAAYAAQAKDDDDKEHTKDARPSTKGKHEKGRARNKKDKGGEKGDKRRQANGMFPRKPPGGTNPKGGWPPKPGPGGLPLIFLLPNSDDNSSVTTTQGPATPCGGSTGNPCPK
jgi:RHS repeat-associated protein